MISRRSFLRFAPAAVMTTAVLALSTSALADMPEGTERSATAAVQTEAERKVFSTVLCMCGCTREDLSTCTCSFAEGYRNQLRGMMAEGMTPEQIKAEWVKRFGPQALAVPPNTGGNRIVYLVPIAAILGMAAFAVVMLRRFRGKGGPPDGPSSHETPAAVAPGKPDDYDQKLDDELKQLDNE